MLNLSGCFRRSLRSLFLSCVFCNSVCLLPALCAQSLWLLWKRLLEGRNSRTQAGKHNIWTWFPNAAKPHKSALRTRIPLPPAYFPVRIAPASSSADNVWRSVDHKPRPRTPLLWKPPTFTSWFIFFKTGWSEEKSEKCTLPFSLS